MPRSDLEGQNRFVVALAAMIAVAIVVVFATQQADKSNAPAHAIGDDANAAAATIVVAIDGAVGTPGVYVLPGDARVQNAIAAAGGTTAKADLAAVNPAARVQDLVMRAAEGQPAVHAGP